MESGKGSDVPGSDILPTRDWDVPPLLGATPARKTDGYTVRWLGRSGGLYSLPHPSSLFLKKFLGPRPTAASEKA